MKHFLFSALTASILLSCTPDNDLRYSVNPSTGAIDMITVKSDTTGMNWVVRSDTTQYKCVGPQWGWGLGYFTVDGVDCRWQNPSDTSDGIVRYETGGITIEVTRGYDRTGLAESYRFTNTADSTVNMTDIGIFTPFNDNYPDSHTCVRSRCNAHVWAGGNSAYICALRMGAWSPHVGLVLTEGSVSDYELWQRGPMYNCRGIIALCPDDTSLAPGESFTVAWSVFSHEGKEDFRAKASGLGCKILTADSYLVAPLSRQEIKSSTGEKFYVDIPDTVGDYRSEITYGARRTYVDFCVVEDRQQLISNRVNFIVDHQQMNDQKDPRFGAFMVYDCEGDSIFPNDKPSCSPLDRDEGAERIGMGVAIARYCLATGSREPKIIDALTRYDSYVRNVLQEPDGKTFSTVDHRQRNRGYNYSWAAELHFLMYALTGDAKHAEDGYITLRSLFSQFGHKFYSLGLPVLLSYHSMKKAGMSEQWKILENDYRELAQTFIDNGTDYPKFEVTYEQSIVAPVLQVLGQMYLITHEKQYLDQMELHMPVLEAFGGFQPSVHLYDIGIRHWDGYWFGKRETFGDVFPHHWTTATASAFNLYYMATSDESYYERACRIVDNNLCQFFPDGKASCAYMYPRRIDGKRCRFYDPYANDQDWALAYYFQVHNGAAIISDCF